MNSHYQNTSVIILAGGKSQRAETIKGLRQLNNEYWLDIQISFFKNIGFQKIYIGLGFDHQEYSNKSKLLSRCDYVINPNPENGSFSTLQYVLNKALSENWDNTLLIHIDHALPKISTLEKLLKNNNYEVIKPQYKNKSGHPIILSRTFSKNIVLKPINSQLNKEIKRLKLAQILWVEVKDKNILENFNTQDKWQNYTDILKNLSE